MTFRPISIALLLSLFSLTAAADELVKIRLMKDLTDVKVSGLSLSFQAKYYAPSPYQTVALPSIQSAKIIHRKSTTGISHWQVNFPGQTKSPLNVFSNRLYVQGQRVKVGMEPVPSSIYLLAKENQRIDIIAELEIDTYLAGVLPSEMPAAWPMEALKAQAVASRSYMRNVMQQRNRANYHLEASIHDQVYRAMGLMGPDIKYSRKVSRAINETRGLHLLDKRGEVYKAFYHSDCGGHTEEPQYVWGMKLKNGTVKDPYCPQSPSSKWQVKIHQDKLVFALADHFGISSFGKKLKGIFPAKKSSSGRISELTVLFAGEMPKRISSQDFRRILGFQKVKSTNFKMKWLGDNFVLNGVGNGHGVGLCQWGSKAMALRGKSFRQILSHYYPKVGIKKWSPRDTIYRQNQNAVAPQLTKDSVTKTPSVAL